MPADAIAVTVAFTKLVVQTVALLRANLFFLAMTVEILQKGIAHLAQPQFMVRA